MMSASVKVLLMLMIISSFANPVNGGRDYTPPAEQWSRKPVGGGGDDVFKSVRQTSDGGYVIAGMTTSLENESADALLVKTDANGTLQWSKTFGGQLHDEGASVQQTTDGGYVFAGMTTLSGNGRPAAWLIKTDADGNEQWNGTFGGRDTYDAASSVQQTFPDGGYIVADRRMGLDGDFDALLIKTDANGNEQWNKSFGETRNDVVYSVQQASDGGYVLAGSTMSPGTKSADALLIKTDANGTLQWNKTFGGTSRDVAYSVRQASDGGYILGGMTASYGAGGTDAWLIKTDANGNEQWNMTFGATNNDIAYSVQQAFDGGYVFAGMTTPYSDRGSDAWLVKTDADGNEQWDKSFRGAGWDDRAYSVQQTADGGYILAGMTTENGNVDTWLIKVGLPPSTPTPLVIASTKEPQQPKRELNETREKQGQLERGTSWLKSIITSMLKWLRIR